MNTDNLIPISYVKQFTPLAVGDRFFNVVIDEEFKIEEEDHAKSLNENSFGFFNNIFLVSFAARPNTGKQPVADDVMIDLTYNGGEYINEDHSNVSWNLGDGVTKWKPNREAMLAKFKQGANTVKEPESMIGSSEFYQTGGNPQTIEPWVGDQLEDLINPVSEGCQADKPLKPEDFGAIPGKPVFTQEQADAGELPPIGCDCLVISMDGEDYIECEILLHRNIGLLDDVAVFGIVNNGGASHSYSHCGGGAFKPIDNRSDEERLRDELSVIAIPKQVDQLLSSDKFTITLKE